MFLNTWTEWGTLFQSDKYKGIRSIVALAVSREADSKQRTQNSDIISVQFYWSLLIYNSFFEYMLQ